MPAAELRLFDAFQASASAITADIASCRIRHYAAACYYIGFTIRRLLLRWQPPFDD